jgi:UDP-N-acetyl-D-glucosamine dehydrogenase
MEQAAKKGARVLYHDPYIPEVTDEHGRRYIGSELTDELITSADCVVFTTNHGCFDAKRITEKAQLVVDMRNAVKDVKIEGGKVFKL